MVSVILRPCIQPQTPKKKPICCDEVGKCDIQGFPKLRLEDRKRDTYVKVINNSGVEVKVLVKNVGWPLHANFLSRDAQFLNDVGCVITIRHLHAILKFHLLRNFEEK